MKLGSPAWLLRLHGGFLVVLTLGLSIGAVVGWQMEVGPFAWAGEAPEAVPGLVQAYGLMLLIGGVLWVGGKARETSGFHVLGMAAHLVPLGLLGPFWSVLAEVGATQTAPASVAIHGGWIAIEASSLWRVRQPSAQSSDQAKAKEGSER